MLENPAKCIICGAFWDFQTDWLGGLHATHPVTKCVPRPVPNYEIDTREPTAGERECIECFKIFQPKNRQTCAKVCSPACRKTRRVRQHRDWFANAKRVA